MTPQKDATAARGGALYSPALVVAAEAALRRHAAAGGVPVLARYAAALRRPVVVSVLGGAGSGANELAEALSAGIGGEADGSGADARGAAGEAAALEIAAVDIDVACGLVPGDEGGALGARPVPDVEVFAWCTAPCAHELRLVRRPRRHPAFVVATRAAHWPEGHTPEWAEGLPTLRGSADLGTICGLLSRALLDVPAARVATALARLERDCRGWSSRDAVERAAAELHELLAETVGAPA